MRRFCIGDIHGAYQALMDVLFVSELNYKKDQLICLGDVADGWPEVPECFNELLKIKNLIYIIGNHDEWLLDWFKTGQRPYIWTSQGGQATIDAYKARFDGYVKAHEVLLENAKSYCVTNDNKLFVHGGFNWKRPIEEQYRYDLTWDRNLYVAAAYWESQNKITGQNIRVKQYDEVFIGHTSTSYGYPDLLPVHISNVWNLDQGAGWEGILTLMDIDSKEYWQSDIVTTLYPNEKGRR
jgi:serine/threonine protein phosphatase 1